MQRSKLDIWTPTLLALMMIAGMMIGYELRGKAGNANFFSSSQKTSLQEVMDVVKSKYVDKVAFDSINDAIIGDVLAKLDPHSVYIPYSRVTEANEELMGNFQGIGIEFQVFNDTINVMYVVKDSPSEAAGIEVGDKILTVNDTTKVYGKKLPSDSIRRLFRGPAGTVVKAGIYRNGKLITKTITRGNIPVPSIDAGYMLAPKTGYIKINRFGDRTYEEFMQQLEKLQKMGMDKLVLDLRGNGGGLMGEATAIADEFLSGDKLIVYTEGNKSPRIDYRCKREGLFENGELVVLVDESSASASEVLTGALQDWDRATIIGRRTFGKGLVQQQFGLSNGGALRLTVARYYTPLGRNIQKSYLHKTKKEYEEEFYNRYEDGELVHGDTSTPSSHPFKTPKGRTVYGGGGITPDIFVPLDTTKMSKNMQHLMYKNTLSKFVYNYYISNKGIFTQMKNTDEFSTQFNISDGVWNNFLIFIKKDSINLTPLTFAEQIQIKSQLKALFARQLFRNEGYFHIINQIDSTVLKAKAVLKQ